jgi:hypothetical protein
VRSRRREEIGEEQKERGNKREGRRGNTCGAEERESE